MKKIFMSFLTIILAFALPVFTQEVSLTGTVVDNGSQKPIAGANVALKGYALSVLTDASGKFSLVSILALPFLKEQPSFAPVIKNSSLYFSVGTGGAAARFDLVNLRGRTVASWTGNLSAGTYACDLRGLCGANAATGFYFVRAVIEDNSVTYKLFHEGGTRLPFAVKPSPYPSGYAKGSAAKDSVVILKEGYAKKTVGVDNYVGDLGVIGLVSNLIPIEPAKADNFLDSIFQLLIDRIQKLDSVGSYADWASRDFSSLRNGFLSVLAVDSTKVKANVGYAVSAILSLNTSQQIARLVDSLDAYSRAMDSVNNQPVSGSVSEPGLYKRCLQKDGVLGLGKAMALTTSDMVLASIKKPSFPKFVTLSYIQNIVEQEAVPVLAQAIRACGRLEAQSAMSLTVVTQGDTFKLDKGEICAFDAEAHLVKAYLSLFCIYDMDLYAPGVGDYRWVDTISNAYDSTTLTYSLKGDTLVRTRLYPPSSSALCLIRTVKYNMDRAGFLTIRKANHAQVKADLLAIPALVKAGFASVRAETGPQTYDVIKLSDVMKADSDFLNMPSDMERDGVDTALARKFRSPESLADFVTELLTGPVTLGGKIDSQHVSIKVNLASLFDNPVTDLRTLFPKYQWQPENSWVVPDTSVSGWPYYVYPCKIIPGVLCDTLYSFTVWSGDADRVIININASLIDSTSSPWPGQTDYYLKNPIAYTRSVSINQNFDPLRLIDDAGKVISLDSMQHNFIPYFNDYTVHGLFPEMTSHQAWMDLVYPKKQ
jgi:hypothetical protein